MVFHSIAYGAVVFIALWLCDRKKMDAWFLFYFFEMWTGLRSPLLSITSYQSNIECVVREQYEKLYHVNIEPVEKNIYICIDK